MKRWAWVAAASGWLVVLVGCGLAANPQPPTLWLPQPVKDLSAVRVGNEIHLHWTMPKDTTDKVALKGDQAAHICWIAGAAHPAGKTEKPTPSTGLPNCTKAGDAMFAPDKPANFTAKLPAELLSGPRRPVAYFVELCNHAAKTAGPSNPAWVVTGTPPSAVMDLRAEARAEGVVLLWQPASPQAGMVLRIHRSLVAQPGAARPTDTNGNPPPEQQTLEVDLDKSDPGQAMDHDAALDHTWRYTVERVLRVKLDGQALEVAGLPSQPVTIVAKDIFPPAVPAGLAVVVDEDAHALDLSWTPDTESDLAGYVVYRRDETSGTGLERVSGKAAVVPSSFEDKTPVPGHRYGYSVSAVDQDGNESARSAEVEEEMPQ